MGLCSWQCPLSSPMQADTSKPHQLATPLILSSSLKQHLGRRLHKTVGDAHRNKASQYSRVLAARLRMCHVMESCLRRVCQHLPEENTSRKNVCRRCNGRT